jgi:hypothetical protein
MDLKEFEKSTLFIYIFWLVLSTYVTDHLSVSMKRFNSARATKQDRKDRRLIDLFVLFHNKRFSNLEYPYFNPILIELETKTSFQSI